MLRIALLLLGAFMAASTLVLGVMSFWPREVRVELFRTDHQWATLSAYDGTLWLLHDFKTKPGGTGINRDWEFGRCRFVTHLNGPLRVTVLRGPFWVPPLIFGLGVGVPIILVWRRKVIRAQGGKCLACGYDLTGLAEPRCPECGELAGVVDLRRPHQWLTSRWFWPALVLILILMVAYAERRSVTAGAKNLVAKARGAIEVLRRDPAQAGKSAKRDAAIRDARAICNGVGVTGADFERYMDYTKNGPISLPNWNPTDPLLICIDAINNVAESFSTTK